ncbi:MAG: ABC-type transport auxiliary lipoprotein family protein [Alphaproteobacteria bacterium]
MRAAKQILFLCLFFVLSACSSLLTTDTGAERTYVLSAINPSNSKQVKPGLSVAKPLVASGLNSQKIALMHDGIKLDYYQGARWSDNLSAMVQDRLTESISNAKIYKFVINDKINLSPSYFLAVDIRRFQAVYGAKDSKGKDTAPIAHVSIDVKLVSASNRQIIQQFTTSSQVAARENSMSSVAAAMDAAFKNVQNQIVSKLR